MTTKERIRLYLIEAREALGLEVPHNAGDDLILRAAELQVRVAEMLQRQDLEEIRHIRNL